MEFSIGDGRIARRMLRLFSIVALVMFLSGRCFAAEEEVELYTQATKAFTDRFYDRAEQQLADFVQRFPASTNVPSSLLLQGQARFFQRRYEAAAELLKQNVARAGALRPEFTFWMAESWKELGRYQEAVEYYRKLITDFPQSPLRLKASYLEAYCEVQLKRFTQAIDLLRAPEGVFQKLAKEAPADPVALRGRLLLGEALLNAGRTDEGRVTLSQIAPAPDQEELVWEKNFLLARLEFASPTPDAALPHLTNAVLAAAKGNKPLLEAQARNLEGDTYRKLNRTSDAVSAYEKIGLIEALPVDQKRLALLKTIELLSTSGSISNALTRLETYLGTHTNEPAADLLRIKAGELWTENFRQLVAQNPRPIQAATNALFQGRNHLTTVLNLYTNSTHLGRAWLNLGWSFWEEGRAFDRPARIQESEAAFANAAEKITRSDDQALAYFKIADAQFALKHAESARSNYLAVVRNYADLPQVRNALWDKAYRQLVRCSIELKEFTAAKAYLDELRNASPNNPSTEETIFLYGQALALAGKTAEARALFQDFIKSYPGSALTPEVSFAEARTYGAEGELETALKKHDLWLRTYTNHVLRAAVEFRRGTLLDQAGQGTNALVLFTNFVSMFPTNALAPAAQIWVADYYYGQEQWPVAEQSYQRVFQNTNWSGSRLALEARLMAAKTAFKRQGYNDARAYLTNLINVLAVDTNAPSELAAEAYFVLGDLFLEEPISGSTNAVNNFIEAARVFDRIATQYSSNKLAVLALGKKGDCHLQLASLAAYADSYRDATNAYLAVLNSKVPDIPVSARNQAEVGIGLALKNMADSKPAAEKERLLKAALNRFLNVVYGRDGNERPDPYFLKVAGLEAGRLAEATGNTDAALHLYRRLLVEAPVLKTFWEARIKSLQQ